MIDLKQFCKYFVCILNIINFLCIGIWEIILIFRYQNNLLINESSAYNFIFICSTLNIINSLALLWLLFNTFIINNYIALFILNIIIGLMSISFSNSIYIFGRFYDVIITEMIMFYSKCIIAGILIIINMYKNRLSKQDNLFEPLIK